MLSFTPTPSVSQASYQAQGTSSTPRRSTEHQLQDVFSAVLLQAGRDGYASAQPLDASVSLVESVRSSWEQWFDQFSSTRYTFVAGSGSPSVRENKTADDLRADYRQILVNAFQQGGYAAPETYLKSLSKVDLAAIQQVHHLADPIQVDSISSEAALNLLLPPDAQVDENRDGLTAVGAAYTLRFPDSNTPPQVRMAWEATTQGMSEQDRMIHVMQICSQLFTANMHFDSNGQFLRSSQPGDADWVNPQSSAGFSYKKLASGWLDYLKRFSSQMSPTRFQRDTTFWTAFRDQLNLFGE